MGKLGIYLVADYPSREIFLGAVKACQECGVDFLEVGFAFSDPVADGDVLERAAQTVLRQRCVDDFVEALREARAIFTRPVYVMTYANIVYSLGMAAFAKRIAPIDGLILADLPLREIGSFERGLKGSDINLIRFLTPESRADDVASALAGANGFIYFVSKRGTTGGAFELDDETREKIAAIRGKGVDVYIGFGIQERGDLEAACRAADGGIIGTRAVMELERGLERFRDYLKSLDTRQA
jgi:tryptophan synthase alpha chain